MIAPDSVFLRAALRYADEFHLPVFPLHSPSDGPTGCSCHTKNCDDQAKHPRTADGSRGASTDPAQIERWWLMWPDANVAVATGPASEVYVLDMDPPKGGDESLRDLVQKHGPLPHTPTVATGGVGEHYYFSAPEGIIIRNSAGKIGPGLDVRGVGGYVVAPPSLHLSGRPYIWIASAHLADTGIAMMPNWLIELATAGDRSDYRLEPGAPIAEGERNSALARLAGWMRRPGMSEGAIAAALLVENSQRCVPPLEDDEVLRIARSISGYPPSFVHTPKSTTSTITIAQRSA